MAVAQANSSPFASMRETSSSTGASVLLDGDPFERRLHVVGRVLYRGGDGERGLGLVGHLARGLLVEGDRRHLDADLLAGRVERPAAVGDAVVRVELNHLAAERDATRDGVGWHLGGVADVTVARSVVGALERGADAVHDVGGVHRRLAGAEGVPAVAEHDLCAVTAVRVGGRARVLVLGELLAALLECGDDLLERPVGIEDGGAVGLAAAEVAELSEAKRRLEPRGWERCRLFRALEGGLVGIGAVVALVPREHAEVGVRETGGVLVAEQALDAGGEQGLRVGGCAQRGDATTSSRPVDTFGTAGAGAERGQAEVGARSEDVTSGGTFHVRDRSRLRCSTRGSGRAVAPFG